MNNPRSQLALATLIVAATGMLWGFYWVPVRALEGLGLPGPLGTVAVTLAAVLVLAPRVIWRRTLAGADGWALAAVALGGAAFALYSVAFVYGRVAMVILLYFLTPVWSVMIGRFLLGWPVSRLRLVAIGVGLTGLVVMLAADGTWPLPEGPGEWMGLLAGVLWSISTTGIRLRPGLEPSASALVFGFGALALALVVVPLMEPWPPAIRVLAPWSAAAIALAAGGLWWVGTILGLLWATARLEPARVGILLMTEVAVGAGSAAWLAGEHLAAPELVGGALVLVAGLLEVWPERRRKGA